MNIIIAGDFVIPNSFQNKDILGERLIDLFSAGDYRLVNLEVPITNSQKPIKKTGPNLRSSEKTILPYLKQLNIDLVTLANNHIMDYGAKGLRDTFYHLKSVGIDRVGAGESLSEANEPFSKSIGPLNIAFLNFAENEWSNTYGEYPGANPLDIINNVRSIRKAKESHDKVVVIIHGGNEYFHYPSPRMVKQYRYYVDEGADAIISHHSHCIGGYEIYNGVPILYGLGNFIFIKQNKPDSWYEGLIVKLQISNDKPIEFKIHPVKQDQRSYKCELLNNTDKGKVLEKIETINYAIKNPEILKKEWEKFIVEKNDSYLRTLSPVAGINNNFIRRVLFKLRFHKLFFNDRYSRELLNRMRCEAHFDAATEVLKNELE